jgi:hypothetical protein
MYRHPSRQPHPLPAFRLQLQQVVTSASQQAEGEEFFLSLYRADFDTTLETLKVRQAHRRRRWQQLLELLGHMQREWEQQRNINGHDSQTGPRPQMEQAKAEWQRQQAHQPYIAESLRYVWGGRPSWLHCVIRGPIVLR